MSSSGQSQEIISPRERLKRWEPLLNRSLRHVPQYLHPNYSNGGNGGNGSNKNIAEEDPFDCSKLSLPSVNECIEQTLSDRIEQWKQLDSRKVVPAAAETNNDPHQNHTNQKRRQVRYGFNDDEAMNRLRLPLNFDFKSEREPPSSQMYPNKRTKVISLMDPTKQLDYETELWKLFRTVPTRTTFEKSFRSQHIPNSPSNIIQLRDHIDRALREYTRVDCHALSRLRIKDRHHLPMFTKSSTIASNPKTINATKYDQKKDNDYTHQDNKDPAQIMIVRVECWKRQLKRGSPVSSDRLEMEFLGTQTLLDVHNTIVKQAADPLQHLFQSGLFFIENTFYIKGDQNYALPIIQWLNDGDSSHTYSNKSIARKDYLGFQQNQSFTTRQMGSTQLQSLNLRLGVRYVHTFNGDLESSLFFTDIRTLPQNKKHQFIQTHTFPSILDHWSSPLSSIICEACSHSSAVVICCNDELACGGGGDASSNWTKLCPTCYYKLHYDSNGNLRYNNFECFPLQLYHEDISKSREPLETKF